MGDLQAQPASLASCSPRSSSPACLIQQLGEPASCTPCPPRPPPSLPVAPLSSALRQSPPSRILPLPLPDCPFAGPCVQRVRIPILAASLSWGKLICCRIVRHLVASPTHTLSHTHTLSLARAHTDDRQLSLPAAERISLTSPPPSTVPTCVAHSDSFHACAERCRERFVRPQAFEAVLVRLAVTGML